MGEKAGENIKVGKAHVATGAAFCWWSCPFPRPLNSILRRWTTSLQFLSGLPFPVPALQHGTLDLDFSRQTQLSPAAFQPHGPLVSGTGSGHGPPSISPRLSSSLEVSGRSGRGGMGATYQLPQKNTYRNLVREVCSGVQSLLPHRGRSRGPGGLKK